LPTSRRRPLFPLHGISAIFIPFFLTPSAMASQRAALALLLGGSLAGSSLLLLAAAPARALVTLKVKPVGPDLVVTGSGSALTSSLTPVGTDSAYSNVLSDVQIYAGPPAFSDGSVSRWSGLTGPAALGVVPAVFEYPDSNPALSFGDLFGILTSSNPADIRLVLPSSYVSGASLSGRTTYTNLNLAQAGLTAGTTYTWTWGSGSAAETIELQIDATPVPVPAPLPIAGAAAAFHTMQRLRRRVRSI
jgi:hypothetical protein